METLNYCCDTFRDRVLLPKTTTMNIRIIKWNSPGMDKTWTYQRPMRWLNSRYLRPQKKATTSKLMFIASLGYTDEWDWLKVPSIQLNFCPFCGTDLLSYYKDDRYANEIEGQTFPMLSHHQ